MKRIFLISAVLFLGSAATIAQTQETYKDGLLKCSADKLMKTEVTAHLETAITPGKNLIWCSSFQLAWNEACKLVGEDLHFVDEPPMVAVLNKRATTKQDIDEASCLVIADWLNPGLADRIAKAIRDKFGDRADPQLFNETRALIPPREPGLVSYAYLLKELSFAEEFKSNTEPFEFGGKGVQAFGIWTVPEPSKREKQVSILYEGARDKKGESRQEFVIELKTTSDKDRLIVAMVAPQKNLSETIAKVHGLINKGRPSPLRTADSLVIPKFNIDITRNYKELTGCTLKVANPRANGIPVAAAAQRMRFQLNEKGVKLHSEGEIQIWGVDRHMRFDSPFLVLMERKGAKTPYLAIWVDNAEILVPAEKKK